jgi:hypothetical protein
MYSLCLLVVYRSEFTGSRRRLDTHHLDPGHVPESYPCGPHKLPRQAYRSFHLDPARWQPRPMLHAPIVSHDSSLVAADRDLCSQRLSFDSTLHVQ